MRFVVRFSTSPGFISWAIRHRTDFFISHVEFQLVRPWREHEVGDTLGSRYPDGVKWRSASENRDQGNVVIATRRGIDEAAWWLDENRIGYRYDLSAIFGIASGDMDWHERKRRFCSEAVTEGFERGPIEQIFNPWIKMWTVTPRDLLAATGWQIQSGPDFLRR